MLAIQAQEYTSPVPYNGLLQFIDYTRSHKFSPAYSPNEIIEQKMFQFF